MFACTIGTRPLSPSSCGLGTRLGISHVYSCLLVFIVQENEKLFTGPFARADPHAHENSVYYDSELF